MVFLVVGDERFYRDTNAADVSDASMLTNTPTSISCDFVTSNAYLSGTTDDIFATFKGKFSLSGPHVLGPFPQPGSTRTVSVTLTTPIGELLQIVLQKRGADGWLLAGVSCKMGNVAYELVTPRQWLENVGAFEDNVQDAASVVPVAETLTVSVARQFLIYGNAGLLASNL